ncbi:MAG: YidH family protein [Polymorphobacter sp.]
MSFENLNPADQMASMRTSLAFQRTRMAAERTMMAILRTSLAMIGFGFTIYTFFTNYISGEDARGLLEREAPTRFGMALIALGILLMVMGIANHYHYMKTLRGLREDFKGRGYLQGGDGFPVSLTLIVSFLLVVLGFYALLSIGLRAV